MTELQAATKPFTQIVTALDKCSVSGSDCKFAAKYPTVYADHCHHHTFLHLPPPDASTALHTYLRQKAHAPYTTSCCVLVPAWKKASFSRLLKGMTLLKHYDKGKCMFRQQNGQEQSKMLCGSSPVNATLQILWLLHPCSLQAMSRAIQLSSDLTLAQMLALSGKMFAKHCNCLLNP